MRSHAATRRTINEDGPSAVTKPCLHRDARHPVEQDAPYVDIRLEVAGDRSADFGWEAPPKFADGLPYSLGHHPCHDASLISGSDHDRRVGDSAAGNPVKLAVAPCGAVVAVKNLVGQYHLCADVPTRVGKRLRIWTVSCGHDRGTR